MIETHAGPAPLSKDMVRAGIVISALPALFMLLDAGIKLARLPVVAEALTHLGYPAGLGFGFGVLTLVCTVLYIVPRTSILGAVLLTGYLGGAVASHVRIGDPFYFPLIIGALLWGGLYLRDQRLHAFLRA